MTDRKTNWSRRIARLGAYVGVAAALFIGSIRVVNEEMPWSAEMVFGQIAFTAVYLAPFALSLWALRWPPNSLRTATWAGAAVLALAGIVTAFSGVTFALLPAGVLLAAAALVALRDTKLRDAPFMIGVSGLIVLVGVASFWSLLATEDERCWQRHKVEEAIAETDGWSAWEAVPSERTGMSLSSGTGRKCTSNATAWHESAGALGLLVVAGLVIGRGRRREV